MKSALPKNQRSGGTMSLETSTLAAILEHARPLGHHEEPGTLNIGFGFVYYGLVRALRPRHIVVIGSVSASASSASRSASRTTEPAF